MPSILSINNYYYPRGGAEVVFLEQNRIFEEYGWKVIPFSMHHPKNMNTPWSEYFVSEIEYGHPYSIWETIKRVPKTIYSIEARQKLSRLLDHVKPDIAHCHNIYHHISPSILSLLKDREVPVVLTLHDLKLACPAYLMMTGGSICERCKNAKLYNVVIQKCIKNSISLSFLVMIESVLHRVLRSYERNVDRFIVPSIFLKKKLVEWGYNTEQIIHIPNFVNVDMLRPGSEVGEAYIYFGRLSLEKGLKTLIKAGAIAEVPLWIAGTGPQESYLRTLAEKYQADVKFLGYLSGDKLYDAVRSARATVLPSEGYENAPISIMESYALGTPVIGAAIGGIPELLIPGFTGTTFQSGSVESLAAVLRRFTEIPNSRLKTMGGCGRRWMENQFTANDYRDHLLDLYAGIGFSV